jgi:plastocyanin
MRRRWLLCAVLTTSAAVLAVACGGGGGYSSPTEPPASGPKTVTIEVRDFSYEPRQVTINPGDTVRWVYRGADPTHTVTEINGTFASGASFNSNGAVYERTFTSTNATFNYSCDAHKDSYNMKGSIRVGDSAPSPNPGYR